MKRGIWAKRSFAAIFVCAGGLAGCRDLVFEDGHRIGDDHVLAGRSAADGADTLTVAERTQGWFVSSDAGLSRLEADLRTRLDLSVGIRSTLQAFASGQTKVRDPRAATPALTNTTTTLSNPVTAPIGVPAILRQEETNPGELKALCAHPLLGRYIGDSCNGLGDLDSLPMDDLKIDVDAPNISVDWDAPRQVARTLRPSDEPGSCTPNGSGVRFQCKDGFACPRDSAGTEIAGTCVWSKPCETSAECIDPACAAWGGCTTDEGHTAGVCNTSSNRCGRYVHLDAGKSDRNPTAPAVRVRVPFDLSLDPNDAVGALIVVNLKKLVVDFRLQPQVCNGAHCRTFGRLAFDNYSPADVVFSTSGVDVRARSNMVSRDYEIIPTPLCFLPGAELALSPFIPLPPGSAAFTCVLIATDVLPPLIDRALTNAGNNVGPLVDTLLNPPAISVPADSLPPWLPLDTSRVYYRTADGRTLPLAGSGGAWTNNTVDVLAKGAAHSHINVNLNDSPVPAACTPPLVAPQCDDLCGDRPVPCDLSNAKICLHFHGQDFGCDGGLRLTRRQFQNLMETIQELPGSGGLPTDDQIEEMIEEIADATAPIPAVPQLATLLDAAPFVAKTFQSVFTKPLEEAFGETAHYTDIVHCPATGTRPASCPSGVDGPVFKFLVDTDHDGIQDADDECPTDADPANVNTDGDTWCDAADYCDWTPSFANTRQYCECDVDGDLCPNQLLGTPIPGAPASVPTYCNPGPEAIYDENPTISDGGENTNRPSDWVSNDCDPDDDGDGVLDASDNCPQIANSSQADQNNDGYGDACDPLCPGPGAPCPLPEHHDPTVLPMGMIDFDFGAHLIGGCFADGPGCWGFFRVGCESYGAGGACFGGSEVLRWLAPNGAAQSLTSMKLDVGSLTSFGDITKDGFPDLLISAPGKLQPTLSAIDGASGKQLWQTITSSSFVGTSIAVGPDFIAVGTPDHVSKTSGSADGAVQLLSLDGKPLGEPILGPVPGGRFGSSLAFTGGMLLVGAPGKMLPKSGSGGRIYAAFAASQHPMLLLDGNEIKAPIGAVAPVAMTYAGADVLVVPAGGSMLVVERIGKQYGKLGKVIAEISTGTSSLLPASMSEPADFDGDGVREIAIGVPGYLKSAGTVGFLSEDGKLRSSGLWLGSGARFGDSVVALGDLDGDGASELGVTIPGVDVPKAPFPGSFVILKKLAPPKGSPKP